MIKKKLTLNKRTIAKLDDILLKEAKGGVKITQYCSVLQTRCQNCAYLCETQGGETCFFTCPPTYQVETCICIP